MKPPTIEDVLQATAEEMDVTIVYITQKRQLMGITKARHITQYMCRKYVPATLAKIGEETGGRDHASVTQAFQKIDFEWATYDEMRNLVEDIENNLRNKGFSLREVIRQRDNDWFNSTKIYRT